MNKSIKTISHALLLCIFAGSHVHACYIDLTKNDIENYIGSKITFHAEYQPEEEHHNQISFPKNLCYPVQLDTTGDIQWFFTSALKGSSPCLGEAIAVTNQYITHVYVVSGEAYNGNWFYVYFGLDINNPKFQNKKHSAYQGSPLFIVCKNTSYMINTHAKYLDSITMESEVRKYLPLATNCDYKSQIFQNTFKNLFLWRDGSLYTHGRLVSSASFWLQVEDVVKTRQYKNW